MDFLRQRAEEIIGGILARTGGGSPSDTVLAESCPALWWALNTRSDHAGNAILGATLSISSDGPSYVCHLTLRSIKRMATIRVAALGDLFQALEDALADPETSWRPWEPFQGGKRK